MSPHRATSLIIETPEGVDFSYDLASPAMRALAWMVDAAVIMALSRGAGKGCEWLGKVNEDWANAISVLLYFAISVGYGIALEWRWHGQTLGKRVVGLRVVDAQGLRLQLSQVVLRNLLRLVDMLPAIFLVGGLPAGTIVARGRHVYCFATNRQLDWFRVDEHAGNTCIRRWTRVTGQKNPKSTGLFVDLDTFQIQSPHGVRSRQ